jgi:tetratricopeptide (TPR) repeat protein
MHLDHLSQSLRTLAALVTMTLVVCASVPRAGAAPAAADKATAKQHYRKGVTEYNLGRFDQAISHFEQAYSLDPSPILIFNIGQAHRRAGNGDRAIFFLRRYLAEDPETKDRPRVEGWIKELEEAAKVKAVVAPPPATVPPAAQPPPTAEPPSPIPVVTAQPAPPPVEPAALPADRGEPVKWQRPAAWIAGGLGVGALALGIQQTLLYGKHNGEFARNDACDKGRMDLGGARCGQLFDDGNRAKKVAIVGYVSGGILLAASAALFITSAFSGDAGAQTASASVPRCMLLGAAASCTFAF